LVAGRVFTTNHKPPTTNHPKGISMRITVLLGGPSSEREVSLISGKSVAEGLRAAGHEVFESDIDATHLAGLDHPCDVVFPVLHGAFGESGELQEILEARGLPFVGSGSASSRLGINKQDCKRIWQHAGLPVPVGMLVTGASAELFAPCVVKPVDGGSSIDVEICPTIEAASRACERLLKKYPQLLAEAYVEGTEITVGILEEQPLPPIRISTTHEFFDFTAKYVGNDAKHHFDLNLPPAVVEQIQKLALRAHQAVGCRDLSRLDFILDRQNRPYLLEINTMPGFTPKSLLPEMAAHEGISFPQLVDRLVRAAADRVNAAGKLTMQLNRRVTSPAPTSQVPAPLQPVASIVR
jgi:D-alanine-D-alanine ligase